MIGKTISHYRILEKLGEGGMGVVFRAEDLNLDRSVALKFLPPHLTRDPDAKARFIHEAKAASALQHNHICAIHEIDETEDGRVFISMDCYAGETLKQKIAGGPLPLDEAINTISQAAEGLSEAHASGMVHRDVKPANIMVTDKGVVKILDFGLAKLAGQTKVTKTGTTVGTVAYMSPEQVRGDELDSRSDIFSLGVVLYELLTGELPFKGDHEAAVLYQITNSEPKSLRTIRSDIPERVQHIVSKALVKEPASRYQHLSEMLADLEKVSGSATKRVAAGTSRRNSRRRAYAFAAILAFVLIASSVILSRYVFRPSTDISEDRTKIVVIPFDNLGSPQDEYFAAGITDAITAHLAGLHGLGVISRQSAVQFKESGMGIREIGEESGAAYVLEGTVQRERPGDPASRVRIIPQLIRVSDDTHLWVDTYDEEMADVFWIQSQVAERVALALNVTLFEGEQEALEARPTNNLDAYEYYLRGNSLSERFKLSTDGLSGAIEMYMRAVELDAEFSAAWAALSQVYIWLYWLHGRTGAIAEAITSCDMALRSGPDLPETHLALGYIDYYGRRDHERALHHFKAALAQRPSDAETLNAISLILRRLGRWDESLKYFEEAAEMQPGSASADYYAGWCHTCYRLGRYEEAEQLCNRAISKAPDGFYGYARKAYLLLISSGDTTRAAQVLSEMYRRVSPTDVSLGFLRDTARILSVTNNEVVDLSGRKSGWLFWLIKADMSDQKNEGSLARAYRDSARASLERKIAYSETYMDTARVVLETGVQERANIHSSLGLAYAGLGQKQDAIREGERAVELCPVSKDALAGPDRLLDLAQIYAMTGEHEAAMDRIENLLTIPSELSVHILRLDPIWDPLRDTPRFQHLLDTYSKTDL